MYDSGVESGLVSEFEKNRNVKVYAKLPSWFKIDTPLGTYNPDWALLWEDNGEQRLFFVVESKGSIGLEFLRPVEQGKIECGKKHFEFLSEETGKKVSLKYVSNLDEFANIALGGA